ncbi:MAG: ATP-binding domain-containing protein [Leptolyngbyaceae cyanobacterium SU_3_3]|nr:ATP-binding domain-containing protein [Leptolyngbyaceae cyanobacterium SU_3_3]
MKTEKRENSPTIDKIVEPRKRLLRSSGLRPMLLQVSGDRMAVEVALQVKMALESHAESSIAILVDPTNPSAKSIKQAISKELRNLAINHHAPMNSRERVTDRFDRSYVIIDSWNAVKGVEFEAVILVGIDFMTEALEDSDRNFETKAGLYTAMTRAKDHLVFVYENKTAIVALLETALNAPEQLRD